MGLGGKVAIVGSGVIKFGENFHQSLTDMVYEAVTLALADARVDRAQLQAAWFGCYEPMLYGFEGNSGTFVSDPLNLFPIPVTRVAAYCATGIEAVRNASLAIASGEYDLVLAVGAEKMREVPSRGSLVAQAVNRGHPVLAKGRTAPGMFALLATRYFKEYGANEDALCAVAMAIAPRTEAMYIVFTLAYALITGLTYAGFSAVVLEAIGRGAAATKYNVYASLSNIPIAYMTAIDGWARTRWNEAAMLYIEAAVGIAALLFFAAVAAGARRFSRAAPGQ